MISKPLFSKGDLVYIIDTEYTTTSSHYVGRLAQIAEEPILRGTGELETTIRWSGPGGWAYYLVVLDTTRCRAINEGYWHELELIKCCQ